MKNAMKNFKNYSVYLGILFLSLSLNSCSDDDDGVIEDPATGSITASDQTLSGNTLIIEDVTVGQDTWVVVRNSDDQELAADPVLVEEDEDGEVRIPLNDNANLTGNVDGDDFDVYLYADNPTQGTQGVFDEGIDQAIRDNTNAEVRQTVNTTAPNLFADDNQMVSDEGDVTFSSVNTGPTGGYIALYGQNEDGTPNFDEIIGQSEYIEPGEQTNVTARLVEGYNYTEGQTFYPRLHTDNPEDQQFTFRESNRTEDLEETYGFDMNTGQARFVGNNANTETQGGFTVGNTGTVPGATSSTGAGGGM